MAGSGQPVQQQRCPTTSISLPHVPAREERPWRRACAGGVRNVHLRILKALVRRGLWLWLWLVQVASSGVRGAPALHFVVECAEPNGPVRLARTYFFSTSPQPRPQPNAVPPAARCSLAPGLARCSPGARRLRLLGLARLLPIEATLPHCWSSAASCGDAATMQACMPASLALDGLCSYGCFSRYPALQH